MEKLTKREHFAILIMQGALANSHNSIGDMEGLSNLCIKVADTLIKSLDDSLPKSKVKVKPGKPTCEQSGHKRSQVDILGQEHCTECGHITGYATWAKI